MLLDPALQIAPPASLGVQHLCSFARFSAMMESSLLTAPGFSPSYFFFFFFLPFFFLVSSGFGCSSVLPCALALKLCTTPVPLFQVRRLCDW